MVGPDSVAAVVAGGSCFISLILSELDLEFSSDDSSSSFGLIAFSKISLLVSLSLFSVFIRGVV